MNHAGHAPGSPQQETAASPTPPGAPVRPLTDRLDAELDGLVQAHGGKPFQARQIRHWAFRHGVSDWDAMRNVPAALRAALAAELPVRGSRVAEAAPAADGTTKLLLELADGETVETVIIPDGERWTLCVSSQVGCPVACVFCASGLDGVRRNLTAGEIVEQVLHARDRLAADDLGRPPARFTNIVVMGLGEPLLNLDNLARALERIQDPDGIGLGARRITVSTSGHPERMLRFADLPHAYGLALSLHAAEDGLRRRLVPTAKHPVAELVDAARRVFERTGREVTFEVVLLRDVNDRPADARAMIEALRGLQCTVNLIPWNPVDRIEGLARPHDGAVDAFASDLRRGGLKVTVRRQRGADKNAACGQLRLRRLPTAPS